MFGSVTRDKDVDGFTRLLVPYRSFLGKDVIFIDLNARGKLFTKPEHHIIKHFYDVLPSFSVATLSVKEMIAEKISAAINRNKPRDHFDIYQIIKHKLPIDMDLVKKKCVQSGVDYSIIRMFNKAKTLKNRWDYDMVPLIVEEISFQEVMHTLAKHFKLKDEKVKEKNNKQEGIK